MGFLVSTVDYKDIYLEPFIKYYPQYVHFIQSAQFQCLFWSLQPMFEVFDSNETLTSSTDS